MAGEERRGPEDPAITEAEMPDYMDQDTAAGLLAESIESIMGINLPADDADEDEEDTTDDQDDDQSEGGEDDQDDIVDEDQADEQSEDDEDDEEEEDENAEDDDQADDEQSDDDSEVESASGLFARDENGKLQAADPHDIKVTLPIDGEQQTMTLAELSDGYMRTDDYTRKTTQFAERVAQGVQEELESELVKLDERGKELDAIVELFAGDALRQPSFDELLRRYEGDHVAAGRHLDNITSLRNKIEIAKTAIKERDERKTKKDRALLTKQAEKTLGILKESIPEWKDQTAFKREEAEISKYLEANGATGDDLLMIMQSPKYATMLRDAAYGAKVRGKKPELRKQRLKAAKRTRRRSTGRPAEGGKADNRAQSRNRARKRTGSEADSLLLLEGIL